MTARAAVHASLVVLALSASAMRPLDAQPARRAAPAPRPPAELLRLSLAAEKSGLAAPFTGITTQGAVESGLFGIRSTGVTTEPVRRAADAFLSALRDLGRLSDGARFGSWLMSIAVHQAHRRFRRRRLLARLGLDRGADDARLEQIADPALSPELRSQLGRLDRALAQLPTELRLAWMLRHVEGCELSEAAEQCGCSLATVKRRIGRADGLLERWLGTELDHAG